MRQLIIARKDLNISPGKLAAQVSHASMAFLITQICQIAEKVWKYRTLPAIKRDSRTGLVRPMLYRHADLCRFAEEAEKEGAESFTYRAVNPDDPYSELERCENDYDTYRAEITISKEIYEQWINGIFTKTVCEAKNRKQLLKAKTMAEEMGLKEGEDFFLIKDNCLTELEPEEIDENGVEHVLTCIGFRPLPDETAHAISKKYHLYT